MQTKKALKNAYRQHKARMGVFQVKNTISGKVLLEGSTDVDARWNRHQTELRFGSHRNKALQQDWKHQAATTFEFSLLSELEYQDGVAVNYREEVEILEKMLLEELQIEEKMRY